MCEWKETKAKPTLLLTLTNTPPGGSKGYDCPICRQGFFSVANLKAHVTTHCIDQQYKCPTCLKVSSLAVIVVLVVVVVMIILMVMTKLLE